MTIVRRFWLGLASMLLSLPTGAAESVVSSLRLRSEIRGEPWHLVFVDRERGP